MDPCPCCGRRFDNLEDVLGHDCLGEEKAAHEGHTDGDSAGSFRDFIAGDDACDGDDEAPESDTDAAMNEGADHCSDAELGSPQSTAGDALVLGEDSDAVVLPRWRAHRLHAGRRLLCASGTALQKGRWVGYPCRGSCIGCTARRLRVFFLQFVCLGVAAGDGEAGNEEGAEPARPPARARNLAAFLRARRPAQEEQPLQVTPRDPEQKRRRVRCKQLPPAAFPQVALPRVVRRRLRFKQSPPVAIPQSAVLCPGGHCSDDELDAQNSCIGSGSSDDGDEERDAGERRAARRRPAASDVGARAGSSSTKKRLCAGYSDGGVAVDCCFSTSEAGQKQELARGDRCMICDLDKLATAAASGKAVHFMRRAMFYKGHAERAYALTVARVKEVIPGESWKTALTLRHHCLGIADSMCVFSAKSPGDPCKERNPGTRLHASNEELDHKGVS